MDTPTQQTRQTLSAIVYPQCCCGLTWKAHQDTPNLDHGYVPSAPIRDLGIISDRIVEV